MSGHPIEHVGERHHPHLEDGGAELAKLARVIGGDLAELAGVGALLGEPRDGRRRGANA